MSEENKAILMVVATITTLSAAEVGLSAEDIVTFSVATTEYFEKVLPILGRDPDKMGELMQLLGGTGSMKGEQHEPQTEERGDFQE